KVLFAVLIGLGVASGLARAADSEKAPTVVVQPAPIHSFPEGSSMIQPEAPGEIPEGTGHVHFRRVHGWLYAHKVGCWSPPGQPFCGSCRSEWLFLFGSCRQFFGEPCLPEPRGGFGARGDGGRGCGCP